MMISFGRGGGADYLTGETDAKGRATGRFPGSRSQGRMASTNGEANRYRRILTRGPWRSSRRRWPTS